MTTPDDDDKAGLTLDQMNAARAANAPAAGVVTMAGDLETAATPRFRALTLAGGTWLRLDTDAGAALVRAEPGMTLDYDRGRMRIAARDGREFFASGVGDDRFDEIVGLINRTANGVDERNRPDAGRAD